MPRDDSPAPELSDWATAAELASMTEVWRQLLTDHVPNSQGAMPSLHAGRYRHPDGAVAVRPAQNR